MIYLANICNNAVSTPSSFALLTQSALGIFLCQPLSTLSRRVIVVAHEKRFGRKPAKTELLLLLERFTSKLLDGDNVPSIREREVYIKVNYVSFCGRLAANPWFASFGSRCGRIWSEIMECLTSRWGFGRHFNNRAQECSVLIYACVILGIFLTYLWKKGRNQ